MARTEGKQQKGTQTTQEDDKNRSTLQRKQQAQVGSRQTALAQRQQSMPGLITSPFSFMRRFAEGMEQLFGDFGVGGMPRGFNELALWTPQIEMFERENQLVIRADLPGLKKDDVQIELRDDSVVIQGERQEERKEEREGFYSTERTYGRFYREIPLPEGADTDEATATFRDGVLEITMPAEEGATRGRQLQIQDSQPEQGKPKAQAAGASR
ncbi:MAG TPA: Hsp20/alpha crystallin family protein [Pyrinomonadaceae bacterium]